MPSRDRLKALRLVTRLKQYELEAIGAELSGLRANLNDVVNQSEDLAKTAFQETANSTTDTRPYLPSYLASVDQHQRKLSRKSEDIEAGISKLQSSLLDAFRDVKTKENVLSRLSQEVDLEVERAENSALDDATRSLSALKHTI
jgi:predicted  nucleic acid-binding Zn-ribbon protein